MVSVADVVGLLVILGVNTTIAALATRFFRVRLNTGWGSALYTALLLPLPLVAVVLVLGGIGLGPNLGTANAVLGVTIVLPMALGIAFDFFWMPAPDEVDVPDRTRQQRTR
ncbi:hypothetical protein ACFR9U_02380 [Halorientalis brevis]|uniref:DUF7991 domain-containing protein n=1 Tax=Halorientalis brevis TaxID=1126241 RepID=A0ABD6C719_9EURY|nr:hypothetical protein [Halorientalis brevis]